MTKPTIRHLSLLYFSLDLFDQNRRGNMSRFHELDCALGGDERSTMWGALTAQVIDLKEKYGPNLRIFWKKMPIRAQMFTQPKGVYMEPVKVKSSTVSDESIFER